MKKIFLLGVGSQKSGTTWLHSQLSKSQNIKLGMVKEHHVFDSIYSNMNEEFTKSPNIRSGKRFIHDLIKGKELNKMELIYPIIKYFFTKFPNLYFQYFNFLHGFLNKYEIVGDITPSYSLINQEGFELIKKELQKKNFDIKIVFLMRDPFERIWSMLRMKRRNILLNNPNHMFEESEEEQLREWYKDKRAYERTRYDKTIRILTNVFDDSELFFGFYETIFTKKEFQRLEEFLGVNLVNPDFNERKNVSKKNSDISSELKNEIKIYYKQVYKYCNDKFSVVDNGTW